MVGNNATLVSMVDFAQWQTPGADLTAMKGALVAIIGLIVMTEALPAFCTIVFMPFTYSIANGVAVGLIMFCLVKLFSGKGKEIRPLAAIVALVFVLRYAFMTLG